MKKTFLPTRSLRGLRRTRKLYSVVVLVIFLFLVLLWRPVFLSNLFYTTATPLVHTFGWIEEVFSKARLFISFKSGLIEENKDLLDRLAQQEAELSLLRSFSSESESLSQALVTSRGNSTIIAGVLLAPPLSPYDVLVLDRGVSDGVEVGDTVKTAQGIGLGTITEVFKSFSRATLLSSPGSKVPVRIGSTGVQAEAIGTGGGEFQLLLPRELEIHMGDPVVSPGLMSHAIGVVGSIQFRDVDFLQLVSFVSPVNLASLRFVVIEKDGSTLPVEAL